VKATLKNKTLNEFLRILIGLSLIIGVVILIAAANVSRSKAAANYIYYSTNDGALKRMNLGDSSVDTYNTPIMAGPNRVAVDPVNGMIYYTDAFSWTIMRMDLDPASSAPAVELFPITYNVPYVGNYNDIALDVNGGYIYFTTSDSRTNSYSVLRAKLNGAGTPDAPETIYSGINHLPYYNSPCDIALDLKHGKIYVTDCDYRKIMRMGLDGSNLVDVVPNDPAATKPVIASYNSIVLDVNNGKIYFTSDDTSPIPFESTVQRANLDGSGLETLYSLTDASPTPTDITLDLDSGKIYLVDMGNWKIQRTDLDGTHVSDVLTNVWVNGIALNELVPTSITLQSFAAHSSFSLVAVGLMLALVIGLSGLMIFVKGKYR
jgi:DNA-binding beta-propeller fold protein YncE